MPLNLSEHMILMTECKYCPYVNPKLKKETLKIQKTKLYLAYIFVIIIIIDPLTARVVWAPQMISQPVSFIFPVLHCPLGLDELQACPFPDVVFPSLHLLCLPCLLPAFTLACKMALAPPDKRKT